MDTYQLVVLAALLHDLGKFWQRTGQRHGPGYEAFGEADYGPHGAHAKWSADFIERYLPAEWRAAASGALFHHQPRDYVTKLVTAADWLSSGERDDTDVQAGQQASQLLSVCSHLTLQDGPRRATPHFFGLEPLAVVESALFPRPGPLSEGERRAAYARLWQAFTAELGRVPRGAFDAYLETLYHLLQKYTWCVPSAYYRSLPDVSLFDHGRTTAAIAAALYRGGTTEAELDALLHHDEAAWRQERLTLLGGDISGVQAFLYTITAKGAAKGLRGRSFYLQLLGEAIARWLVRELELSLPNLVYVGGGRFYLLTQRLDEQRLARLRRELDERLLRCHPGELYVALAAAPVRGVDLRVGPRVSELWAELGRELNERKRRKFADLPPGKLYGAVFAPSGEGGPEPGCAVCRREGPYAAPAPDEEERKCALCLSLEALGAELREAEYLYLGQVEPALPSAAAGDFEDALRAFGLLARLFADEAELRRHAAKLGRGALLALRSTDFVAEATLAACRAAGEGLSLGFYLLANVTPLKDGEIADFADLAAASRGVRRLGVLRMDVDDLGAIFARGLGEHATLSRVASLSFLLRLYFEGWLAELARRRNRAEQGEAAHVYTIYSGGDDLFVVGAWDQVAELALEVRRDFGRFVGQNPDLHLSGGIALEEEKFPLYQAAEHAGEALERAKAREQDGRVAKDALDFLGHTAAWASAEAARERARELVGLVERGGAPRALVHTLARIYRLYLDELERPRRPRAARRDDQVPYGRWMWLSAYLLTRIAERLRAPWDGQVRGLQAELLRSDGVRTLGLAARWAELQLRKEGQER